MSRRIMTGLLREKLGFGGIIISDCMEMDAIKKFYGTVNGVLAAMKAGVDLVFVSQTPALAAEAMQNARRAAENGELDLAELDVSVQRMLEAKAQCAAMQPKTLGDEVAPAAPALREVRAASITAVRHLPQGGMPALGDNPCFWAAPTTSTIASTANPAGFTFPEEMRRHADKGTAGYRQRPRRRWKLPRSYPTSCGSQLHRAEHLQRSHPARQLRLAKAWPPPACR